MVALQGVANCWMSVIWMLYGWSTLKTDCMWLLVRGLSLLLGSCGPGCWLLHVCTSPWGGFSVPVARELAPLTAVDCFMTKSQESHTSAILFLRSASLHPRVAGSWLHLWGQKWQCIFRLGLKSPQWALRQKLPIYSNGVNFTNFLCKIIYFL